MFELKQELVADLETPVSAFLKLRPLNPLFLLESVEGGEALGRYSFIGLNPMLRLEMQLGGIIWWELGIRRRASGHPWELLRETLARLSSPPTRADLPRFSGGLVGFVGYDAVRFMERLPETARPVMPFPLAAFYLPAVILAFDHVRRTVSIIGAKSQLGVDETVEQVHRLLSRPIHELPSAPSTRPRANQTAEQFVERVMRAKEYIAAGDIFQVVLSIRFEGETQAHPFQVYRALRMINPSPYMYYLDFGSHQIVGSSPEMLVRLENGQAMVRPIAGTRPRGADQQEDDQRARDLLADEKERAEHLMLVDLARNDLGRVAQPGTVTVPVYASVERYSHVMHLVSSVECRVAPQIDMIDLFQAVFPAGTVTGAPKIRAMQIIEELEGEQRGPYAGCVGYFGLNGNMDHAITLRTTFFAGGRYYIQAGAGIVADSVPQREYHEIHSKAQAMFRALEMAGGKL
ncbi:MAG: anthranilate synthase component I [Acidobacteriota bacterium]|nr:anthranilate synthase component I [Blastocatellia bacterium]MDW8240595.1 anthranilate synthase component I [Acidobacteriota bacterium]